MLDFVRAIWVYFLCDAATSKHNTFADLLGQQCAAKQTGFSHGPRFTGPVSYLPQPHSSHASDYRTSIHERSWSWGNSGRRGLGFARKEKIPSTQSP